MRKVKIVRSGLTVYLSFDLLERYSQAFFKVPYAEKKNYINSQIRNLISPNASNAQTVERDIEKLFTEAIKRA